MTPDDIPRQSTTSRTPPAGDSRRDFLRTGLGLAAVSLLLGSPYGGIIIVYGLIQGLGGEIGFLLTRYRSFGWGTAVLAGVTAGLSTSILDTTVYYADLGFWAYKVPYTAFTVLSSVLLAGVVGLLLVRALARTGALSSFASGRSRV